VLALLLAVLAGTGAADTPTGAPSPPDPDYRVGPGDVLEVSVAGRPDLSRLPTIQPTGIIHYPVAGDVPVADLSIADVAERLGTMLSRAGVTGAVSARVREYHSRSVFVEGEVKRPGRQVLKSAGRLVDALVEAGGFTAQASGDVRVDRRNGAFEDGATTRRFRFEATGPTPEDRQNLSLLLAPGDVITVQVRRYVFVSGAVARPGTYTLDEGMTVTQALEAAGGITRLGNPKVVLERAQVAEGEPKMIEVDTGAVKAGEAPDPTLRADDRLLVRGRKL
jgi:polysaccharide export outer membrane protein